MVFIMEVPASAASILTSHRAPPNCQERGSMVLSHALKEEKLDMGERGKSLPHVL